MYTYSPPNMFDHVSLDEFALKWGEICKWLQSNYSIEYKNKTMAWIDKK